jgi:predicted RND superfamily exporter protein
LTGDAYVSSVAIDRLIRDLFFSLLAAAAVIFVVIGVLFRSPRIGLISTLPNITPLAIVLGYMGWRGYEMNATNSLVFSISLGIAVDDTIHFLARFKEETKLSNNRSLAIQRTLEGAGKAIVLTTFLIVSGLSVMMFSSFVPTRRMAELVSISLVAALVGDLLLLPACLALFWKQRSSGNEQSVVHDAQTIGKHEPP